MKITRSVLLLALVLAFAMDQAKAKKADNLSKCSGKNSYGAFELMVENDKCITYRVGPLGSWESDKIAGCSAGCLVNGKCDETYECNVGSSPIPFILISIGVILGSVYRFLAGCYFKPQRTLKKLESDAFKEQNRAEIISAGPKVNFFA